MTRTAYGMSPEELSIYEAYLEGARAGMRGLSPSLNPYQDTCLEHHEWNRGRMAALVGQSLNRRTA
jgi:hypothetical protein